jgi:hypothetical protein
MAMTSQFRLKQQIFEEKKTFLDALLVNKQNVVGEYFSPFFPLTHHSFLSKRLREREQKNMVMN